MRAEAADRARHRPAVAFEGRTGDAHVGGVPVRRYRPGAVDGPWLVFLHGGYGVFGDLDLQDGLCRRLATGLGHRVVAVDYPLTPEHTFTQAVAAVTTVARRLGQMVMAGDSAGGALAVAAARRLGASCVGLFLTNPNLDLSLGSLDVSRPGGPDPELLRFAMTSWLRPTPVADAPQLQHDATGLPPAVIAVGSNDGLEPECRSLAEEYRRRSLPHLFFEVHGADHGFMGAPDTADRVIRAVRGWWDTTVRRMPVRPVTVNAADTCGSFVLT